MIQIQIWMLKELCNRLPHCNIIVSSLRPQTVNSSTSHKFNYSSYFAHVRNHLYLQLITLIVDVPRNEDVWFTEQSASAEQHGVLPGVSQRHAVERVPASATGGRSSVYRGRRRPSRRGESIERPRHFGRAWPESPSEFPRVRGREQRARPILTAPDRADTSVSARASHHRLAMVTQQVEKLLVIAQITSNWRM